MTTFDYHPNLATALILVGTILPLVSAAVTGSKWLPEWAAGYVTAFFAAAIGFVGTWQASPNASHYDWAGAAFNTVVTLILAYASRYGAHRNTPITQKLQRLGSKRVA